MTCATPFYEDEWATVYHADCLEWTGWVDGDVLVTDPPYGIAYSSAWGGKFKDGRLVGDRSIELRDAALALWGNRPALCFGSWKAGRPKTTRHVLLWEKGDHVGMGDLDMPWRPNVEEIYVLGRGFTGRRGSSVLRFNALSPNFTPPERRYHPTEKPVSLMHALVAKCPSGLIADPFMGSGSTLLAAKNLGRRSVGVEIEEHYCQVAAGRLANTPSPLLVEAAG